ncbi:hypothetical protein GCM10023185_22860 [Hymenobacter saemangeumensis]|uniref:Ig-like domain-containing protein n=1 Tax=Hymenobacter saemangeumensis TaxID=1084522 RepID=A0ABP8IFU8_9BACT
MNKLLTFIMAFLLGAPAVSFAQCSGQYDLTYPAGSSTNTIAINNGSGPVTSNYCPAPGATQTLVFAPSSPGSITVDRTVGGVTTTLQTYTTVAGGTYTLTLPTVTAEVVYTLRSVISCNNQKNSTINLTLAPSLALNATATTVCSGGTTTLTATGSNNGSYTWSAPGMANITNSGTLVVSPSVSTNYTVTAPTSCSATTTQQLSVVVPTLTGSSSASPVCAGTTVTLTAASNVAGATFTWTSGGTTIGTGASINVTPASSTTYRVTSSNPSSCSSTSFRDVPVTVTTQSVSSSPASATINRGSSVTLTASSNFSGATYTWRTGGSTGPIVGSGATLTVSPTVTTTYTVVSSTSTCGTAQRDVTVTVNQPAPLPVELTQFEARWNGQASLLTWATASESDNEYFQVERSADGQKFESAGRVAGAGTTSRRSDYSFLDAEFQVLPGMTVYYRLRQVDASGKTQFSPVKTMTRPGQMAGLVASIYPNPVEKAATLAVVAPVSGPLSCSVRDIMGRELTSFTLRASQGAQELELPSLALPKAGLYFLMVRQGGQQQVLRFEQR